MKKFSEFAQYDEYAKLDMDVVGSIVEYLELCEIIDQKTITESWIALNSTLLLEGGDGKISKFLEKLGLHAHKTGPGLLSDLKKAGKGFFKFFVAALKGDKATIKKMAGKEITKEQLIDFLMKLDTATLHLISGPIHTIEALTGWHIGANITKTAAKAKAGAAVTVKKIGDAIKYIKDKLSLNPNDDNKTAARVIKTIEKIEKIKGIGPLMAQ